MGKRHHPMANDHERMEIVLFAHDSRVVIVPYFLTKGIYLRRDLPLLVAAARETSPGIGIEVGQPLEGHPLMPSLVCARAQEVVEDNKAPR